MTIDAPQSPDTDTTGGVRLLARGERWLAVFKPSGILVHRGWARDGVIATDVVRDLVGAPVHPAHRLDRATSGVLLFALDPEAAARLQSAFAEGRVWKRYAALVRGEPEPFVTCRYPLKRGRTKSPSAQERVAAETHFVRLWTGDGPLHCYSLVNALPTTGRMHQIRRHLKHLSHPIIGDVKYGKGEHNRWFRDHVGLHRLALHAAQLSFPDPGADDGRRVTVVASMPEDLTGPLRDFGVPEDLMGMVGTEQPFEKGGAP